MAGNPLGQMLTYPKTFIDAFFANQRARSTNVFNIMDAKYASVGAVGVGNTAADTAAFNACWADALAAQRGEIRLPAGEYHISSFPQIATPFPNGEFPFALRGAGKAVTRIYSHATSEATSMKVGNPDFNINGGLAASGGFPAWGGFSLDGTNSSGGACGLIWGDIGGGTFEDMSISGFTTGDGMQFRCEFGWLEKIRTRSLYLGNCANLTRYRVMRGKSYGLLATSINAGDTITQLQLATGTPRSMYNGEQFIIYSGSGTAVQIMTTNASVPAGSTTIPVASVAASAAYAAGTAEVSKGGYGSFDYWDFQAQFNIGGNQNGIVSEIGMGIGGNRIDRVGSKYRIDGNAQAVAGNTGAFLWTKGVDGWDDIAWNVDIEGDGGGGQTRHTSLRIENTKGGVGGHGKFCLHGGWSPPIFPNGASQYLFSVTGRANVPGITSPAASGDFGSTPVSDKAIRWCFGGPAKLADYKTSAFTTGSQVQNPLYADVLVTVMITGGAADGTLTLNQNYFSGIGSTAAGVALPVKAGQTYPFQFVHHGRQYLRFDDPAGAGITISPPIGVQWV